MLDPQQSNLPAVGAGKIGDIGDDILAVPREDQQPRALAVLNRFGRGHRGQAQQLGLDLGHVAAGDGEAHCVMVTRAAGELRRRRIGEKAAMSDDDRPAAHRLDLLEQMGRDHDRLVGPHRGDDLAHLVFLVGVEPVGRLVEDQHLRIVQQRLRDPNAAPVALRQGLDRLVQNFGDVDHLDHPADAQLGFASGKAADSGDKVEELGGRHVGIGRRALGQVADAALGRDRLPWRCHGRK